MGLKRPLSIPMKSIFWGIPWCLCLSCVKVRIESMLCFKRIQYMQCTSIYRYTEIIPYQASVDGRPANVKAEGRVLFKSTGRVTGVLPKHCLLQCRPLNSVTEWKWKKSQTLQFRPCSFLPELHFCCCTWKGVLGTYSDRFLNFSENRNTLKEVK